MKNSKFCWTCHSISPNLVVEAFPKISIKKHFQCDMWSWLGWEKGRAGTKPHCTGAQSLFHRKPNLANCCQSETGKPPSWARPASQFWASTLPHTLEKSHDQALTGSRITIPGFFGTGFCQIPGSRDFSGRDFPIFLIPGFRKKFRDFSGFSFLLHLLVK